MDSDLISIRRLKERVLHALSITDDITRVRSIRRRFNQIARNKHADDPVRRDMLAQVLRGGGSNPVFVSVMRHSRDCKQDRLIPNQFLPSPLTRKGEYGAYLNGREYATQMHKRHGGIFDVWEGEQVFAEGPHDFVFLCSTLPRTRQTILEFARGLVQDLDPSIQVGEMILHPMFFCQEIGLASKIGMNTATGPQSVHLYEEVDREFNRVWDRRHVYTADGEKRIVRNQHPSQLQSVLDILVRDHTKVLQDLKSKELAIKSGEGDSDRWKTLMNRIMTSIRTARRKNRNTHVIFCGHGKWIWENTQRKDLLLSKQLRQNVEFAIENAQLFPAIHVTGDPESSASGLEISWVPILHSARLDNDCQAKSGGGLKHKCKPVGPPHLTINKWKSIRNADVQHFVPVMSPKGLPRDICREENVCKNKRGMLVHHECDGIYSLAETADDGLPRSNCLIL